MVFRGHPWGKKHQWKKMEWKVMTEFGCWGDVAWKEELGEGY